MAGSQAKTTQVTEQSDRGTLERAIAWVSGLKRTRKALSRLSGQNQSQVGVGGKIKPELSIKF